MMDGTMIVGVLNVGRHYPSSGPRDRRLPRSAFGGRLNVMRECPYCGKIRDEWECHGSDCREAIARALRRQRQGRPMVPKVIRNEIPNGASTTEVIAILARQRLRARRSNEERRERKALKDEPGAED
jgi:hypothetical protein